MQQKNYTQQEFIPKLRIYTTEEIKQEIETIKNLDYHSKEDLNKLYFFSKQEIIDCLSLGIHISENLKELIKYPPTVIKIWIDKNYLPHYRWEYDYTKIDTLYVLHNSQELLEVLNFLQSQISQFNSLYDNEQILRWVDSLDLDTYEEE